MSRFILFLITTLHIIFAVSIHAQQKPALVRFDYPEYIPVNSVFDVSVVIKFDELPTGNITYTFGKDKSIRVQSAYLNKKDKLQKLFVKVRNQKVSLAIPFEELKIKKNLPVQIILKCSGKGDRRVEGNLFYNLNLEKENKNQAAERITRFYTPQITAGKSLLLTGNSELKLHLKNNVEWEKLYVEFWLKSESELNNFFSIIKPEVNDTLLNFSKNRFSFLSIPVKESETLREDVFLANKAWNYIAILLNKNFDVTEMNVFVNSEKIYTTEVSQEIQDAEFIFATHSSKEEYQIDRLKIWNFNNSIEFAQQNKNFSSVITDSSRSLIELDFNKRSELRKSKSNNNIILKYSNLKYIKSDAPVFSKAPKITVTIGSSYNSIVWYVQEFSMAKKFILEKSTDSKKYKDVYTVDADDDPLKIYTYIDEVTNADEVSYYRIKQINKDSSEVISPEVKVGNKEISDFTVRQNYPNPFNPLTNIYVDVLITTEIKVNVYDLVGNKVEQLYDGILPQGLHTFPFDGSSLPSGIYFYEVASPHGHIVKKMILTK